MKTEVAVSKTERGFSIVTFQDDHGKQCSLQKSSAAEGNKIWFGCDEIGLKRFTSRSEGGEGWQDVPLEQDSHGAMYIANTRMHLTQESVLMLLPYLQRFAETGELSLVDS